MFPITLADAVLPKRPKSIPKLTAIDLFIKIYLIFIQEFSSKSYLKLIGKMSTAAPLTSETLMPAKSMKEQNSITMR